MIESAGTTPPARPGDDAFERRLFALIDSGDLHFPKGARRPALETPPRSRVLAWLGRFTKQDRPRLVLAAALAYGVALVVCAPLYWALTPTAPARGRAPATAVSPPSLGSAQRLDLGAGPTRSATGGAALVLSPRDAFVVLSFLVPIAAGRDAVHTAVLEDGDGRVVARQRIESIDALGNFVLVCRSDLFASGEYRLSVLEASPARTAPGESLRRFSFLVTRAQR